MTERFRAQADQWRSTVGLSDKQMAQLIHQDQIDILIDLAGHTAGNRLLVFAQKPAPVQITWLGYPNTTGLTTIDYRITDAYTDPPGLNDALHSEQLIRLPQTNWIYQPPQNCPPPNQLSVTASIRFGCFNNFSKVTEPMMRVWAQILENVPNSTLLLKANALTSPEIQQRVRRIFQAQCISPERLELMGWTRSAVDHLTRYNQIAIALDPFPYHGTTTTCEALWMGVPVITLAGQTHVSRVGVSLLTNVGLPELIAESPEDYIRIAVELANDLPRLQELRSTLRQRMEQSPLMDAPKFARNIEAAYRQMWHNWCQTVLPGS
jgi:predicted O-linked N-acetylglucosamine transferase (SPINDLY family)